MRRAILLGLGTAGTYAAATFAGVLNVPELADPKTLACILRDEAQHAMGERAAPPKDGVRVLVARLDLDKDGHQTRHVVDSLRGTKGFEVQQLCRTLAIPDDQDVSDALRDATAKGRSWLADRNAAILVWGQVEQEDKSMRLRLLTADSESADRFLTLADDLRLPKDYAPSLSVLLSASVLSQSLTLTDSAGGGAGGYVGDRLVPMLPSLRGLAESAGTLPEAEGDTAREAYLSALITLAGQQGELSYADEARAFAERALAELPESRKEARATVAFWRARALQQIGGRKADIALLAEAEKAYRGVLDVWTEAAAPVRWARAQTSLAAALRRRGMLEDKDDLIESALDAQNAALRVFTRDKKPLDWARTRSGLGSTYALLGERRQDPALLEKAVSAFQDALSERKREQVPLAWAASRASLAGAEVSLGTLKKDPALLDQAIAGYRDALEIRRREQVPLAWASTEDRLGDALMAAGRLARDTAKMDEGIAAYRAALEVRTREAAPAGFADTALHLGNALLSLAELKPDRALYQAASDRFSDARAIYEAKGPKPAAEEARLGFEKAQAKLKGPGEG